DIQWNHLGSHLIHVDLARVDLSEEITVELDVTISGDAVGLKTAGAILEHPQTNIEISCKANNIPELINVDVTDMQAGETISVADLKLPEGVTAVTDGEAVIAVIHVMAEVTEEEAGEGTDAEPEVIGRPAKEEEAKD
ncbi:MAG: 50S ribosomal protein L25, partial [Phycisphaeraceae bacterium]|nr:50S ribosomal protein L25 [Phycisphaeraceae bacterium]